MKKLYCYVDETGQDSMGHLFIVVAVLTEDDVVVVENYLTDSEKRSGKRLRKWTKTPSQEKSKYLDIIFGKQSNLKSKIFFKNHGKGTTYSQFTFETIRDALNTYMANSGDTNYKVTVIVDGLNDREKKLVRKGLSLSGLKSVAVAGARDEGSALLRLSDAVAGLIRDADEGDSNLIKLVKKLTKKEIIYEL